MKAVTRVLAKPLAQDNVRFVGNVEVGRDLTHDDLAACYDAVVYASGTERDRWLGIPGASLPGAVGIVVEHTRRAARDRVAGPGEQFVLPVGMVVTAVGFRGAPLDGLPFSEATGTVPNVAGRAVPARQDIVDLLAARNRLRSDWAGWLRLEEYEGVLGDADGRGRVKVHDLESMLRYCSVSI